MTHQLEKTCMWTPVEYCDGIVYETECDADVQDGLSRLRGIQFCPECKLLVEYPENELMEGSGTLTTKQKPTVKELKAEIAGLKRERDKYRGYWEDLAAKRKREKGEWLEMISEYQTESQKIESKTRELTAQRIALDAMRFVNDIPAQNIREDIHERILILDPPSPDVKY